MKHHPVTFFGQFPNVDHHNLHMVTSAFVFLLLILGSVLLFRKYKDARANVVPDGGLSFGNVYEMLLDMLANLCTDVAGKDGKRFLPFIGSMFIFLFISNLMGLIPGFLPPTEHPAVGASIAAIVFIAFNYLGFKEHGLSYFKHFVAPVSVSGIGNLGLKLVALLALIAFQMLFSSIEMVSLFLRPITLSLRLFVNINADHSIISIFNELAPYGVPIIFMMMGLFVSFMQAFIFSVLSLVYVSLATAHDH